MPRIEHKRVGEFHVLTSPDGEGLYVAHRDLDVARAAVEPQIETLRRMADRKSNEARVRSMVADVV